MTRAGSTADLLTGLHVLADDDPRWKHDPVEQARAACRGGAGVVQLRAKYATDREALAWARAIRAATAAAGALFFVNDRFDLALAAAADGVHLGQDDVAPGRIPLAQRERLRIGRSTHTPAQLRAACGEPVDYVAFGPVFGTATKDSALRPRGLEALAAAVTEVAPRPLVAIGGIDARNVAAVAATGASAAVISAVANAPDMEAATFALAEALRRRPEPER